MKNALMRLAELLLGFVLVVAGAANVGAGSVGDDGRVQGKVDAPLTLIEYSDFTCGYCMKFFKETLPRLQATYIDTGKIKFVYRLSAGRSRCRSRSCRGGPLRRSPGTLLGHA